jgi:hypothetical protein
MTLKWIGIVALRNTFNFKKGISPLRARNSNNLKGIILGLNHHILK